MPGRTARIFIVSVAFMAGCAAGGQSPPDESATTAPSPRETAEALPQSAAPSPNASDDLALIDKAGLVVMTALPGGPLDEDARRQLSASRIGGVIWFSYNAPNRAAARRLSRQLADVTARGSTATGGMLVAIDQEGGPARNIPAVAPTRSAGGLGRGNADTTRGEFEAAASGLLDWGVHINLAPVADLDLGPHHVMRGRAFAADPEVAADHVAAAVEGAHAAQGLVTLKHFPGLGRGNANTDDDAARIPASRAELHRTDFVPFAAGIAAGADLVMTTHAVVPAIDDERPASLSPAVHGLLRDELGFDGVVITDSLNAKGLRGAFGGTVPEACAAAVAAGADIALVTGTLETAGLCARAIRRAVESGELPAQRLDEAAARVLALKQAAGLFPAG